MENRRPPLPVIIVVVLVVLVAGYYGIRALAGDGSSTLKASGTIETTDVSIGPEISGRVSAVSVTEGDAVKAGSELFRLDDVLLQSQRKVATASLDTARAGGQTAQTALGVANSQYAVALDAARAADQQTRLANWYSDDPNQFIQPQWYFSRDEQLSSAQAAVTGAKSTLDKAQANVTEVEQSSNSAEFLQAEQRLSNARMAYLVIKDVDDRAQKATGGKDSLSRYNQRANPNLKGDPNLPDASQALLDSAKIELSQAQVAYNNLLKTRGAGDVLHARAELSVAQELYDTALDHQRALLIGDQSPAVMTAQMAVAQAQAAADQAQKAIAQAQAQLDQLDTQLSKLVVSAPLDGVILTRNVEPGEFVQPGATAVTMGNLDDLTITVYVPEDRYGQISIGQAAQVVVDSFAGQTFKATVSFIADQAEFTPRNVQTVEGRSSTVYAVKLKVSDPEGKLKPGMPADVTFLP